MDFAEFKAMHMPALEQDEVRYNVILAQMARDWKDGEVQTWSFAQPGACAMRTPGRGMLLGDLTQEQCEALAETVASTCFDGVLGAGLTAKWLADRAGVLGARFKEPMAQQILVLSAPPAYPGAQGCARHVTCSDGELFAEWFRGFLAEAAPDDPVPDREQIDAKADSGDCLFWVAGDRPVAMAGIVRRLRKTAALALVYTPHELRGQGYAGSATAAVVDMIFKEGRSTACLYVDRANPASNRCYEKIGFRPACESWYYRLIAPAERTA